MAETDRARFLRRAAEAKALVARLHPELLDTSGTDTTLHDLTLALSPGERLEQCYRQALAVAWLRGLKLGPSTYR